jgi:beta-lactamase class D
MKITSIRKNLGIILNNSNPRNPRFESYKSRLNLYSRTFPAFYLTVTVFILLFFACSTNNVTEDLNLQKHFDKNRVSGCFGLFDNGKGEFTLYNTSRFRDSAYLPASTFKIVNSLIGIETGRVKDDSTVIAWNGKASGRSGCDRDLKMDDAFRISCVPWFQELARQIGKDTMQYWLDSLGYAQRYGRFVIKDNIDTFWLDNSAKITGDEQLGLVKKLYFNQLPFQKRTQSIVRDMMKMESNAKYVLSYKTGWGFTEKGHALGWMVGWIEENHHPYFFILQLEHPDRNFDMAGVRVSMLKAILREYGFMEGKK